MKIQVTKEDIENGVRKSATSCAVSLAVRRLFPGCSAVKTLPSCLVVYVDFPEQQVQRDYYILPVGIARDVMAWDAGGTLEPFEFELKLEAV